MAKKLKMNDALLSLYGVPFEEALAGVLAVKPPQDKEGDGQEKLTVQEKPSSPPEGASAPGSARSRRRTR
jgi:hypothetical protein